MSKSSEQERAESEGPVTVRLGRQPSEPWMRAGEMRREKENNS